MKGKLANEGEWDEPSLRRRRGVRGTAALFKKFDKSPNAMNSVTIDTWYSFALEMIEGVAMLFGFVDSMRTAWRATRVGWCNVLQTNITGNIFFTN